LEYCKKNFQKLFIQSGIETRQNEKEEDRIDRETRYFDKLFGNIDFIGELYLEFLVSESILYGIFDDLFDS